MKFSVASVVATLALGLSASAQMIEFLQPADGASFVPGQGVSIQIGQPRQQSGFVNAAITFGFEQCGNTCPNVAAPGQGVGDVLQTFVFSPSNAPGELPGTPPNQNFSLEYPTWATGKAVLSATLFYFGTAALAPAFTQANITLNTV